MGCIIVGMPRAEDARKIGDMLKSRGLQQIETCTTGAGILSKVHLLDCGIVICPRELKDMYCGELAESLPDYFEMLLLATKKGRESCPGELSVITVPFRAAELYETVEAMLRQLERRIRSSKRGPKKRNRQEQELVDQAKKKLMEQEKMTEPEAFRSIQKYSMDSCISMTETAVLILQRYLGGSKESSME